MTERTGQEELLSTAYGEARHTVAMDIATKIRRARMAIRGLTQRKLAKCMGVSPAAVAQWETAKTVPTIPNRVELSHRLRIPLIDLLPEADTLGPISVSNPETLVLVRHFEELPPAVRTAIVVQVVSTAEALRDNPKEPETG